MLDPCQVQLTRLSGNLLMGPGTPYTVLPGWDPWSRTVRSPQSGPRAWAHGSYSGAEWMDEAVALIPVSVNRNGATQGEWLAAHQELARAFGPVGASGETCELAFEWGGNEYVMFGTPRSPRVSTDNIAVGKAVEQVVFIAADPRIYSGELLSLSARLPVQQGGLIIPAGVASTLLRLPGVAGSYASTPHHASMDATGVLQVTCDADLESWANGSFQQLASIYESATNNISWSMNVNQVGTLRLQWSEDGSTVLTAGSSVDIAAGAGHLRVRATLTPDDGGAREVLFETAQPGGAFTQFGDPVPGAVTSVFVGNAPLEVGSRNGGLLQLARGDIRSVEVRIAGVLVADPSFDQQAVGDTNFDDSTGKTWTVNGDARLVADTFSGGLTVPFTIPGVLVGGKGVLANAGTTNTGITVRIALDASAAQPLVEPWFVLQLPDGTVQSVRFDLTLSPGQWLDIDSTTHLALLNGLPQSNQRGRASWLMETHPLPPGDTTFRFGSGGEFNEDATATVSWRSAWI